MIKQVTKASVGYVVAGLMLLLTSFNAVAEPDIFYFHNDHLGTPQVVTDQDQNVVWKANYTPFGEADIVVEDIEMNIRFPGQYYDKETGYHYNYYRTYDPSMGRYIQSDPIGLNGGLNTYGYVGGNPTKYMDPLGLKIKYESSYDEAVIKQALDRLAKQSPGMKAAIERIDGVREVFVLKLGSKSGYSSWRYNFIPNSELVWNNFKTSVGSESWLQVPAEIALAHELIHLIHDLDGEYLNPFIGDNQLKEELATIGFPAACDKNTTENTVRDDFGLENRPYNYNLIVIKK